MNTISTFYKVLKKFSNEKKNKKILFWLLKFGKTENDKNDWCFDWFWEKKYIISIKYILIKVGSHIFSDFLQCSWDIR